MLQTLSWFPNRWSQREVSEWKKNEVAQSCPILWDPLDCSPPGFSAHEILQARILEWVAISFSRGSSQPRDQTQVSQALQADALTSEPPGKPSRWVQKAGFEIRTTRFLSWFCFSSWLCKPKKTFILLIHVFLICGMRIARATISWDYYRD